MRVIRGLSTNRNQPATSPFPAANGLFIELRGGDVCDPIGAGSNWFSPPFPRHVIRYFCRWPVLPYLSWRFGRRAGYLGWKIYGVDSPVYGQWLCQPSEVYDGSQALSLTARPFATIKD